MPAEPSAQSAREQLARLCAHPPAGWPGSTGPHPPSADPRAAAVLVLFGVLDTVPSRVTGTPVARDLDVLLLRRASTLTDHAGQVAFPGGRIDARDAGPVEAAVREAVEETGLDPAGVDALGMLPPLALTVSNHLVTPVLAWWQRPTPVAAVDHGETVEVFRVPVADLLHPDNRGSTAQVGAGRTWRAPAFVVGNVLVWGFTAIVLDLMFDALEWTQPWDPRRLIEHAS
ncbi:MAG: NUDIX hydrolase [Cellulomonas sp.]